MKVSKKDKAKDDGLATMQADLGTIIRAHRRRMGVTQEELAWRADMHRSYIADIERGGRNITLHSIRSLARALKLSIGDLLAPLGDARGGERRAGAAAALGEVLLVEDNPADADLALRAFKRANITNPVKLVRDGGEALEYLFCRGRYAHRPVELPQIVLLDLDLPTVSGLEILRQLKRNRLTRNIPVAILTVSQRDENIIECSRLGVENYIVKPVSFCTLTEVTPRLNLHWALVKPPAPGRNHSKTLRNH